RRERLGEALIARELGDPQLLVWEGTEIRRVIFQGLLHALDHARRIARMLGDVIDGELDAIPGVAHDRVAGRHHRPEIDRGLAQTIAEELPVAFRPFALQIAWCKCSLIRAGRHRDDKGNEIRILADEIALELYRIVTTGQWRQRLKAVRLAADWGSQVDERLDANARSERASMREAAVVDDRRVVVAGAETGRGVGGRECQNARVAWQERRAPTEFIDLKVQVLVCQLGILQLGPLHLARMEFDKYPLDRPVGAIGQHIAPARAIAALTGIEIDLHLDVDDPWLRQRLDRSIFLLVLDLNLLDVGAGGKHVANIRIQDDVSRGASRTSERDAGDRCDRWRNSERRLLDARPQRAGPAHPDEMRRQRHQHGHAAPIDTEPQRARQVVSVSVHVGQGEVRNAEWQ